MTRLSSRGRWFVLGTAVVAVAAIPVALAWPSLAAITPQATHVVICAANQADLGAKVYTAAPEYYGLYMASRMGTGQFLPITVTSDHNVTAYAVRGEDGQTRIAIIDKDPVGGTAVPVSIDLGRGSGDASAISLTGPSLDSATGVAVQGAAVDRSGHLKPGHPDRLRVRHGTLDLSVATGTAVIVTLDCED